MRKLFALLSSLMLVGSLMVVTTAPALAVSPDQWQKACGSQSDSSHNPRMYFSKHATDLGTNIEGVRGTIHIGSNNDGMPCVDTGSGSGNAYLWAADLQNNGPGLIQWGLCRIGTTGNWKMCYTLWDNTSGRGIVYAPAEAQLPIYANHDYYFQITGCTTSLGAWKWCLYVDDLDALTGDPTLKVDRTWDFNDGYIAWWGVEVQDADGVMGYRYSNANDTKNYIYDMMYKRHDNNTWVYRQQSSCYVLDNVGSRAIYFGCATDNTRYTNDTLRVYTAAQ